MSWFGVQIGVGYERVMYMYWLDLFPGDVLNRNVDIIGEFGMFDILQC